MGWPMQKKYGLANAEKTCLGQCRKNNKTKGGGASRRPLGDYNFLHWPRHVFWAWAHPYFLGFGPCLFFGLWPMLIFLALAPASFFRYFYWLWPGPASATFKGFPVDLMDFMDLMVVVDITDLMNLMQQTFVLG